MEYDAFSEGFFSVVMMPNRKEDIKKFNLFINHLTNDQCVATALVLKYYSDEKSYLKEEANIALKSYWNRYI